MKQYSTSQQQQAALELSKIPKSEVAAMMTDYGQMRAANRECLKHQ